MKKFNLNLLYSILIGSSVLGSSIGLTACNGGSSGGSNPAIFTSSNQDTGKECETNKMATDSDGNLYTNTNCLDNSGINTYTLTKLSSTGNTIFTKSLVLNPTGASNVQLSTSRITGITLDSKNNIYITGYKEVPDIVTPAPYSEPQIAGIVYKYDNKGNFLWEHDFSMSDFMIRTKSITVDNNNDPIIVGEMVNRDSRFDDVTPYFVTKLRTSDGEQIFYKAQAINDGQNSADAVAVDVNNDIIVHGTAPRLLYGMLPQEDSLLVKYTATTDYGQAWRVMESVSAGLGELRGYAQLVVNGTNIYISGNVMGDLYETNNMSSITYYIAKYATNGKLVWGKQGAVSTEASFNNGLTLNSTTNTLYLGVTDYPNESNAAPYIISYTTDGNYVATKKMLSNSTKGRITTISDLLYSNNYLYATGYSNDPVLGMDGTLNLGGFITSNVPQ